MPSPIRPLAAVLALSVLAACQVPGPEPEIPTGAEDFATYCAACHGAGARGDGPASPDLGKRPADLTGLSAANGGAFPGTRVMAKIWGYTGGRGGAEVMPSFAALLDGEAILYDGGDGILSPTPVRLVQLSEYLRLMQR